MGGKGCGRRTDGGLPAAGRPAAIVLSLACHHVGTWLLMSAMSCRRNVVIRHDTRHDAYMSPICRRHVGIITSTCNSFVSSVRSVSVSARHDDVRKSRRHLRVGPTCRRHVADINNQGRVRTVGNTVLAGDTVKYQADIQYLGRSVSSRWNSRPLLTSTR